MNGPAVAADDQRTAVAWFTGADGGSVKLVFADGESFGAPVIVDAEQPPGRVDPALVDGGAIVSWPALRSGRVERHLFCHWELLRHAGACPAHWLLYVAGAHARAVVRAP